MFSSFSDKPRAAETLNLDRSILTLMGEGKHLDDTLTVRDIFEHIFIAGSTGSGKTSTVGHRLASNLLKSEGLREEDKFGMVVFLYKASDLELWKHWVSQHRREQDLIIINSDDKDVFNLLDHYRDKEAVTAVDALMILSGLSLGGNGQKESEQYWEQANRQRLHRLIMLNKLCGEPLNIHTLYKLHSSAPQEPGQMESIEFKNRSYCWNMLGRARNRAGEQDPSFVMVEDYFVREMPYMADRTQSSILSLTSAILEPFLSSPMLSRLFCGGTTINLNEMLKGKIVLLNLPIQQFEYSGKLAQMMFKHVLQKHIEARDLDVLPNPVVLWIDEYQHYISPYDFLFLSTARSARAGCVLMSQNISNLFAQIGGAGRMAEEKVNALLALTNHKFFLAQNNHITNEFASKTIGMGIHRLPSTTVNMEQFGGSASLSESYHYQVMPTAFTMLKRGGKSHQGIVEAIITATGKTFSTGTNWLKIGFKQPWS